jgi:hypothetical protein
MAAQEAKDYYYEKGRCDYIGGLYDQPFPSQMRIELDEFEMLCNKCYIKGYNDEREGRSYDLPAYL